MVIIRSTSRVPSTLKNHNRRHIKCHRVMRVIETPNISKYTIEQALRYAKATLAIEGQFVSKDSEDIVRKRVEGKMTHEEFRKSALDLALNR